MAVRRKFTEYELKRIKKAIVTAPDAGAAVVAALRETYDPLLRAEGRSWEEMTEPKSITPGDYKIEEHQAHEILEVLGKRIEELSDRNMVGSAMLTWMNVGPSTFREEA